MLIAIGCWLGTAALAQPSGPHAEQQAQFGGAQAVPFYLAEVLSMSGPPRVQRQVIGFLPYWVSSYQIRWDLLTQLCWFQVGVRSDGTISNPHGWPDLDLIAEAHHNGVKVTLAVTNFEPSSIATLLSSPANRTRFVQGALALVRDAGADGLNVDLEGVPASQKQNLSALMIELTSRFHSELPGSLVTIDTPSVDWSGAFDYDVLAENSDGLMIMAYGYHWSGSQNAGAVSPLRGGSRNLEWTVADYLEWGGEANRDKFILGLPWYGYDWPVVSMDKGAATTGKGSAVVYASAKPKALTYGRLWDDLSFTAWYRYTSAGQPHQAWYDDDESLLEKYQLVNLHEFGGIGIWALGYDGQETELWEAIEEAFVPASGTVAVRSR
jgi:spore germination protein YaaH